MYYIKEENMKLKEFTKEILIQITKGVKFSYSRISIFE